MAKIEIKKETNKKTKKTTEKTVKKQIKEPDVIESTSMEAGQLFKIICIVLVVFGLFYGITYLVRGGEKYTWQTDDTITYIQYDEIMLGTILNQNRDEYYVMIMTDDEYLDIYATYVEMYQDLESAKPIYYVDMRKDYNKAYLADENAILNISVSDIKIKDSQLILVSGEKISTAYIGKDAVVEHFQELIV